MKKKVVKLLEFAAVIAAFVIAALVIKNISVESWLMGEEEPVTLAMTEEGLQEDYIGLPAADDIPRIEDAETWEDTWQTSCVTIEPINIISTGIGVRHPWVSTYSNSGRRGGSRKRADVTNMVLDIIGEYGEYYLIQLPDESYILAQMPIDAARRLEAGKEITLPVGRKAAANSQAVSEIKDLCREYDVDTTGVFYCINDGWNEEHSTLVQLLRLGIGAVIVLALGTIFILVINKVFKVED